ncbi:MAG: alpha/beta hydrolase [Candidatus Limnocylindrales bacterium]|nr:alpha/beta hydrolase [Candidatus Limnocylindrales bacterium]
MIAELIVADPREQTRARYPDVSGFVERDGVRVFYEVYGEGDRTVLLMPTWQIIHSRMWKAQIADMARRVRVITFDPRGNGRSDRPRDGAAYDRREFADDALAIMDRCGVDRTVVVSWCDEGQALILAGAHPERVAGLVLISGYPRAAAAARGVDYPFDEPLDTDEGWAKSNRYYWLRDWGGFVEFYFSQIFNEPHSTKPIEDALAWGLETDAETILLENSTVLVTARRHATPSGSTCCCETSWRSPWAPRHPTRR